MAEELVSVVLEQLASFIQQEVAKEVRLVGGVRKEIKKLSHTLTFIQAALNDAERKQVMDAAVRVWLQNLKDISYDMEDLLDEWRTMILRSKIKARLRKNKGVKLVRFSPFSCVRKYNARRKIGHGITAVRERLDAIANDRQKLGINVESGSLEKPEREMTSSVTDISTICGRDHDKESITKLLVGEGSDQQGLIMKTQIICIVGMGGLGKTALAQAVFNDPQVIAHFQTNRMWVCVSDSFDKMRVSKAIIEATGDNVPSGIEWNDLHCRLCNALKDKLFLLVLDDTWTQNYADWEPFNLSFNGGANGSVVLVTTRNEQVANMMNATHKHHLGRLPSQDCWSLFSHIAFAGKREEEQIMFKETGMKLVEKCKGVPLFVKTLACAMHSKTGNREYWEYLLANDLWKIQNLPDGVLPALLFSYYALPPHLKRCFEICAAYPKDHVIRKDELIQLWMAHGFLNPRGEKALKEPEPETLGDDYFDELAMRSFFQDIKRGTNDDGSYYITSCKMHDLVHDLAQFLAKNETLALRTENDLININSHIEGKNFRHLSLPTGLLMDGGQYTLFFNSLQNLKNLRTIPWLPRCSPSVPPPLSELFGHLTRLHYLDLSHRGVQILTWEVGKLIYLRYLNLSGTPLRRLPETLTKLCNLQTLILNGCTKLCGLPKGIGKMAGLRHLEFEGTSKTFSIPYGIGQLRNLHTISTLQVNKQRGGWELRELKDLNLLHGALAIDALNKVVTSHDVNEANLKAKQYLTTVKLIFDCNEIAFTEVEVKRMDEVLEALDIHSSVRNLQIYNYLGAKFPDWITRDDSINSKARLQLRNLNVAYWPNCTELPTLGRLLFLERLHLIGMFQVKSIDNEFYGIDEAGSNGSSVHYDFKRLSSFPKLVELKLHQLEELDEWQLPVGEALEIMPCLRVLEVIDCRKLRALPALGKLKALEKLSVQGLHSIKCIGSEFYGIDDAHDSGSRVQYYDFKRASSFPKLVELELSLLNELEEWQLHVEEVENIMPCLRVLKLSHCRKLRALPALGKLKALEKLEIVGSHSNKRIGSEFYGIDDASSSGSSTYYDLKRLSSFSKLIELKLYCLEELEEWQLPVGEAIEIMPCLRVLQVSYCRKLRALPALAKLKALEKLSVGGLDSIKCIGSEFYGIDDANNSGSRVQHYDPTNLREVRVEECKLLRALPALEKLKALEKLSIKRLNSIKCKSHEFCGILDDDLSKKKSKEGSGSHGDRGLVVVFPKLTHLDISDMKKLEKWEVLPEPTGEDNHEDKQHIIAGGGGSGNTINIRIIMPCLRLLRIWDCPKLKSIPLNISSEAPNYWELMIVGCQELTRSPIPIEGFLQLHKLIVNGEQQDFRLRSYKCINY